MLVAALMVAGFSAGTAGSMLGIGGGALLVPTLVLLFDVPVGVAVPASLLCVVANSCVASASHVESRLADIRLGITLELATVAGAIVGGFVAVLLAPALIAVAFGVFVGGVAVQMLLRRVAARNASAEGTFRNVPLGIGGSFVAGGVSSILGVGGGPLKVPLMAYGMGVPFKTAAATSNMMVGVTAAASVAAYAWRGQVHLGLAAPLVVGVLAGAALGTKLMVRAKSALLERAFALVLLLVAVQMLWKGGVALWGNP